MRCVRVLVAAAGLLAAAASAVADDAKPEVAPPPRPVVREYNAPAAKGERLPDRLKVGDVAPDFTLPVAVPADGRRKVTLSDYRGEKPVVLIFGSCT